MSASIQSIILCSIDSLEITTEYTIYRHFKTMQSVYKLKVSSFHAIELAALFSHIIMYVIKF